MTKPLIVLAALLALSAGASAWQARTVQPAPPPTPDLPAPGAYTVRLQTTGGVIVIAVHRDWAPLAADRFYNLATHGYFDGDAFFRVVPKFAAQWGLNPDPAVTAQWTHAYLADEPARQHNLAGMVTFARDSGPNSRTTQVFINLGLNTSLDQSGFAPFGQVSSGMEVAQHLYADYGDGETNGTGPDQKMILREGAAYLTRKFKKLDIVLKATVTPS